MPANALSHSLSPFSLIGIVRLSSLPTYYIPKDGSLQSYRDYINQLPNVDHPEAFGQHTNADIASQIKETRWEIRCKLAMLQPVIYALFLLLLLLLLFLFILFF